MLPLAIVPVFDVRAIKDTRTEGMRIMRRLVVCSLAIAVPLAAVPRNLQTGGSSTTTHSTTQSPASISGMYVYPKNHQSAELQLRDENECYASAKQNSGVDPQAPQQPSGSEQQQAGQSAGKGAPKGGTVAGSAKGAAGGAAIGAIAGDAGQGAAIGATVGAVAGRRKQKKAEKTAKQQAAQQQEQAKAQATAQNQASLDSFKRAFSACMDARGYSVQ